MAERGLYSLLILSALLVVALVPLAQSTPVARDAPSCFEEDTDRLGTQILLSGGNCMRIHLGSFPADTVLEIDISVQDDAIDMLMFSGNGYTVYALGQNYRQSFETDASVEDTIGDTYLRWKTPPGNTVRDWYLILDNLEHDNDQGIGDQGGGEATIFVEVNALDEWLWTPFHDVRYLEAGIHEELLGPTELTLDSGTQIEITVWPMSGSADIYLMTESHRTDYLANEGGNLYVAGGLLQGISSNTNLIWTVPSSLAGQSLYMILDNKDTFNGGGTGSSHANLTVKVELRPPLSPQITHDQVSDVIEIKQAITFSASETPNTLGQIQELKWDFNSANQAPPLDVDSQEWQVETSYDIPGTYTITLTVISPTGNNASKEHIVTIVDTISPTPVVDHNAAEDIEGRPLISPNKAIIFQSFSVDAHAISKTTWSVDGVLMEETGNTFVTSWPSVGEYRVELVVVDPSGNSAFMNTIVRVIDDTEPIIDVQSLERPLSIEEGEEFTLTVSATDVWDDDQDLSYHWDLDPDSDDDGDGNPRNDADLKGKTVTTTLDDVGTQSVTLTVIDASGNSDSLPFSINVEEAPEEGSLFGIIVAVIFVVLVIVGGALYANRHLQTNIAVQLLQERGLSEAEAKTHIARVKGTRNLPVMAKAESIAGLDQPEEIMTNEQRDIKQREALAQQLYGTPDANAGFRPRGRATADNEIAALAGQVGSTTAARVLDDDEFTRLAGLDDESPTTPKPPSPSGGQELQKTPPPSSSLGIQLPSRSQISNKPVQPQKTSGLRGNCSSCGQAFMVELPMGSNEVLVDCPKCGDEQLFQR